MKHLRFALLGVLFLLVSLAAQADSIPVYQITNGFVYLEPEFGFMSFNFAGPGITVVGVGSFDCPSGCFDHFLPEGTPIDFGNFLPIVETMQIGGKTYSEPQAVLNTWTMNFFTALSVPDQDGKAILNGNGLIPGSVDTANGTLQFEIKVPVGQLGLSWVPSIEYPSYYTPTPGGFFAHTSLVPEPGSIVMLVTGLAGILSTAGFSRRHSQWGKKQP
jgi:hypothetical protein